MLTFQNDTTQKEVILKQLQAHYDADVIIKGKYWENGKGCAVGCILHSSEHSEFETRFNIPTWFAELIDTIFKGLPNDRAKKFPLEIWAAIPIGADLTKVKYKFLVFLLREGLESVEKLSIKENIKTQVIEAIKEVLTLIQKATETGSPPDSEKLAVARKTAATYADAANAYAYATYAAADAYAYATYAAADAYAYATYAASYASSAAYAASSAASYASSAAASSAASAASYAASYAAYAYAYADDARENAYVRYADELIRLLSEEL